MRYEAVIVSLTHAMHLLYLYIGLIVVVLLSSIFVYFLALNTILTSSCLLHLNTVSAHCSHPWNLESYHWTHLELTDNISTHRATQDPLRSWQHLASHWAWILWKLYRLLLMLIRPIVSLDTFEWRKDTSMSTFPCFKNLLPMPE